MSVERGTVHLVAHNVTYDSARLTYEYALLDQELPPVVLLDTLDLARAASFVVPGRSLTSLANAFDLSKLVEHEASADALIVREVTLCCLEALDTAGIHDLTGFATDPTAAPPAPSPGLTDAHAELHALPMCNSDERQAALGGCLALSCPDLHKRIEDGITDPPSARACYQWTLTAMTDPSLTRY